MLLPQVIIIGIISVTYLSPQASSSSSGPVLHTTANTPSSFVPPTEAMKLLRRTMVSEMLALFLQTES